MNLLTPKRRSAEATRMAFKAYEIYKATGFYNDRHNIVYDFLDEELLIPFTAQEKLEILQEARKKIDRDIQQQNLRQRKISSHQIARLNDYHYRDIPESKLIALQRYFSLLLREGRALPIL